jgi:hypothetical protein
VQIGTFKVQLIHPALNVGGQLFTLKMPISQTGEFIQVELNGKPLFEFGEKTPMASRATVHMIADAIQFIACQPASEVFLDVFVRHVDVHTNRQILFRNRSTAFAIRRR